MDVDEMDLELHAPESHKVENTTENCENVDDLEENDPENIDDLEENDRENVDDLEENDDLTAEQVLEALESAWLNEKFAPELLPHQLEVVECMLQQISHMEENLKKLKKGDIRINIHTMEISRIRFMISSYLRKRLDKIEEFAVNLLLQRGADEPAAEPDLMTPAERNFATEYLTGIDSLFHSLALKFLPNKVKDLEFEKIASKPNMNKHVFVRAKKSIDGILIPRPGGKLDEVNFEEGSQHIIQYSTIAHLVKSGDVQLI